MADTFGANNDSESTARIYRERWKIELFFEWIKQNLTFKSFLGRSLNAVLTQFWIAVIAYLLLAYLKIQLRLLRSLRPILRLLQLNLFERRNLDELLLNQDRTSPPEPQNLQATLVFT